MSVYPPLSDGLALLPVNLSPGGVGPGACLYVASPATATDGILVVARPAPDVGVLSRNQPTILYHFRLKSLAACLPPHSALWEELDNSRKNCRDGSIL